MSDRDTLAISEPIRELSPEELTEVSGGLWGWLNWIIKHFHKTEDGVAVEWGGTAN